jgi:DNA-directed RNA polymerase subunit RPC12/RpoP
MSVAAKPYNCVLCSEKEASNFYGGRKTLCKKCTNKTKNKKTEELKNKITKSYFCKICGEDFTLIIKANVKNV